MADGSQQVDHALAAARRDHKHVLLQFGANWCGWCRKLDKLFASDPAIASELGQHYLVVLIDVDRGHNQEVDARYGHPTRFGLPAIVVLNQDGKPLTTQDTGQLEQGDHHDPEKVPGFPQAMGAQTSEGQSAEAGDFKGDEAYQGMSAHKDLWRQIKKARRVAAEAKQLRQHRQQLRSQLADLRKQSQRAIAAKTNKSEKAA